MHRSLRLLLLALLVGILGASCGPGELTYQDRAKPLENEKMDSKLQEMLPLLEKKSPGDADDLIRTWNDYLGDLPIPLRTGTADTFVFYDFTHSLDRVVLEASFAPGRREPLVRVGSTGLFYRVYDVPKPEKLRYRYVSGKRALADPFNPDVEVGEEHWHSALDPTSPDASVQEVVGASEANLGGQDLRILLPPNYRRNLGWTYPLVVIVGVTGDGWTQPLAKMMQGNTMVPVIAVSLDPAASEFPAGAELKRILEDRLVPWMRLHYRASALPSDLLLVGWGTQAKAIQDLAAGRTEFWTKIWTVPEDQAKAPDAWNTLTATTFHTLYPVVNP